MERIGWVKTLGFAGAIMAYCMGAGFATGQEALQFFASHGYTGLAGVVLAGAIFVFYCAYLMKTGSQLKLADPQDIFQHFCGPVLGKAIRWFSLVLLFCIYIVMLSAAGAVTEDHTGSDAWIGNLGMATACVVSMFVGFNGLVKVLKVKGPLIILVCVSVSLLVTAQNIDSFDANAHKIVTLELPRVSGYWWLAAILYPCFITIPMSTFLIRLSNRAKGARQAMIGGGLGAAIFFICMFAVALGLISDLESLHKEVPVLFLASNMSAWVGNTFAILLFVGIYTTAASILWAVCLNFDPTEAARFKRMSILLSIVAFGCSLFPFGKLVGFIFPVSGWLGMGYVFFIAVKALRNKRGDATGVKIHAAPAKCWKATR
ncbi:hypothetical protein ACK56M_21210 [Pseudomonas sp. s4]|uniref:YkvI family membrane protein n=1 Tax=Pseudomonas sp. s4 TaxID=353218 RepID=UPI00398CD99E